MKDIKHVAQAFQPAAHQHSQTGLRLIPVGCIASGGFKVRANPMFSGRRMRYRTERVA
jgi:hypothetical protein